jgi:hypothetical protein
LWFPCQLTAPTTSDISAVRFFERQGMEADSIAAATIALVW